MHLVERARAYLGPTTLLVPCAKGTKVPMQPYKDRPDSLFASQAWLALFEVEQANVAVVLGRRSGHLCAVDFDDEGHGLAFDAANPDLVGTLRTSGSRGWQIWLRIPDGNYPASTKTPQCEWRADGNLSVFAGLHPSGLEYRVLQESPPAEIAFSQIQWPAGWVVPSGNKAAEDARAELETAHGPAYFTDPKGNPQSLNEPFWGGLYMAEHTILWSPSDERFYSYDPSNGLWQVEPAPAIRAKLSNRMLHAARQMNVPWLAKQRSTAKLGAIVAQVQAQACRRQPWHKELNFLHVANGVLVWRGDEFVFENFSPDFNSRNASPVAYRPGATCPRFVNELLDPALRAEDQLLLQKFAGLYLLGRNPLQRMLILEGAAATGKSQIARILRGLVGEHNCANLRTELLDERFELANYRGKSLLIGSDVGSDFLSNRGAQTLKALTGGDQLMVELKGCNEPEVLHGEFNVLVTTNCRLRVRLQEDNEAWRRRIAVITFSGQPPEKAVQDFGGLLLQSEGPGLLNWAMAGLQLLFAELDAHNGRLQLDQVQIDRVDRLLLESQSLKSFLKEQVRWDAERDLTAAQILEAYSEWCDSKGIDPIPEFVAQKQLTHLMLELFKVSRSKSVQRSGKNQTGFSKVAFVNQSDEANNPF